MVGAPKAKNNGDFGALGRPPIWYLGLFDSMQAQLSLRSRHLMGMALFALIAVLLIEQIRPLPYQGLVLDLDKKTVSIDGEAVPFTKTEFELLHLLLEEKGRVFSRQELIDRVWPKDVMVLDRTVDVNITRMRKKVGRFAKCIVTRLGFGYYFDA